jgi:dimethylamine/trimethylamine dehydrogenase
MGEEWRRDWHPELIAPKRSDKEVMIVGAGPAGLEAARALGQRGYAVTLLEARKDLGGRVIREAALPGLNEWRRVVDWRLTQIKKMKNVAAYPSSPMSAEEILETRAQDVILATGATWRRDGVGRTLRKPIRGSDLQGVFSPDGLMEGGNGIGNLGIGKLGLGKLGLGKLGMGESGMGNWVIYDDDHYYMGGVLAEWLAGLGARVSLVTPAPLVSYWAQFTLEQERIQHRLMRLGVRLYPQHIVSEIENDCVQLTHTVSGQGTEVPRDGIVLVSDRISNDALYYALKPALAEGRLRSLRLIGDAEAPNIIAQAVFSGHLAAREFDEDTKEGTPFKVERPTFEPKSMGGKRKDS